MMPMIPYRETTIQYITERRCASGGYCFYRLDEPNAGDTFFALASLAILDALPQNDRATLGYLRSFQQPDGSFPNANVGHAVIRSLAFLGEHPVTNPSGWILSSMIVPRGTARPVESVSLFEPLYQLTSICRHLDIPVPQEKKEELLHCVYSFRFANGGYSQPVPAIMETAHALAILAAVDPETDLRPAFQFVKQYEDPEYGFLSIPGSRPSFLENIHAGILACSVLGYQSPMLGASEAFIRKCLRENGGYVRSVFGGSATLENTFLALDALAMIRALTGKEDTA